MPMTALNMFAIILTVSSNIRLVRGSGAFVGFAEAPEGIVYYPPPGLPGKTVTCRTNVTADITWINQKSGPLDADQFNITKVSDTTSTMYLTTEFIESDVIIAGTLIVHETYCMAGGSSSSLFVFKAGELPEVVENPNNLTVNEKQPGSFRCKYKQTRPYSTAFAWEFKKEQNATRIFNTTEPSTGQMVLDISSVMRSDAGTYTCVVENEFGKAISSPATLTVNYIGDTILTVKPNLVVTENSQVTVECIVDSVPDAYEITLSHNGDLLYSSVNSGSKLLAAKVTVLGNNVTVTFTASKELTGQLSCLGKNLVGSNSHSVSLTVQTVPDAPVVQSSDIISSTHSVQYSWTLGKDGFSPVTQVSISCNSQKLTVTKDNVTTNLRPPSILVGLIPGEEYQCSLYAINSVGKSPPSQPFTVVTQSAAPAKPVMGSEPIATTMSSLQIHWTVSYTGGPAISNYTVHWKENSSQSIWSFISLQATLENGGQQNQQGGTWSLMGLKPGTEYLLKIMATNNIGSNASDIVEYATHSCVPKAPSQPKIVDEILNSVHLVFDLPPDSCRELPHYVVRDIITRTELNSSYSVSSGVVTMEVTGLKPSQDYRVQIYIVNGKGVESEASEELEFKTAPKAGQIRDESSSSGLSMTIIAAIIAGGAVGVIILTIIIIWTCRRHQSKMSVSRNTMPVNNARHMEVEYDHLEIEYDHLANRPCQSPQSGHSNSPGRKSAFSDSDLESKGADTAVKFGFEQELEQALKRKATLRKGSDDSSSNEALEGVIGELDEEINKLKLLGMEPESSEQKDGELSDTESMDLSTFV